MTDTVPTLALRPSLTTSSTHSTKDGLTGKLTTLTGALRRQRNPQELSIDPGEKGPSQQASTTTPTTTTTEKTSPTFASSEATPRPRSWRGSKKGRAGILQRKPDLVLVALVLLGVVLSGIVVSRAWTRNPSQRLCLAFEDDFAPTQPGGTASLDAGRWEFLESIMGYGNLTFDFKTPSSSNTFVDDETLFLVPTVEAAAASGSNGAEYIASSRIRTKMAIGYGRVEVRARMPTGDWIWPSIRMLPATNAYGDWPRSGEIDIASSKGNAVLARSDRFVNAISSTLHWGFSIVTDQCAKTTAQSVVPRRYFDAGFHTYGLDWTPTSLTTWIDRPSRRVLHVDLGRSLFAWSRLPRLLYGERISDPWHGKRGAPFDQPFHLVLDVAVGGTSGYFADEDRAKPWQDQGIKPLADFWSAKDQWLPTWPQDASKRGMAVESVRMWQRC
ncbi:uncharacterized protein PFL1_02201 [Pseudozyma flocculosa PF-1]|uniref:Related to beta-1,3-glucan binding protein n=1 Tax=Pseudozyma flocculosa TaxID=84751 RepID=A0A5C3FAD7_9BASI|nr:uncharacterized protein PFL1_02201 [Pseudozyma flocculosa PF-1]EPQ30084.1 hypothetical protein PFL1_02201 [Pseudozyma flocculosa PF-1]SPO41428.1 related to beta-1,3-glucan binding protein [Pseudozyma flocculosa]